MCGNDTGERQPKLSDGRPDLAAEWGKNKKSPSDVTLGSHHETIEVCSWQRTTPGTLRGKQRSVTVR